MGLFDKIVNTFSLEEGDDGFYDEDDMDFIDDEEEEEEPKSFFGRKNKKEEEDQPRKSKITPMRSSKKNRSDISETEIEMFKPTPDAKKLDADICDIMDALMANRTVMLNLEGINSDQAEKVMHTVSGAAYALHGNMVKFSSFIFVVAPKNVMISGDAGSEETHTVSQKAMPYEFARTAGGRF